MSEQTVKWRIRILLQRAMEELADIVSGKKPAPPAWKGNARRPPGRTPFKDRLDYRASNKSHWIPALCVGWGWDGMGRKQSDRSPVEVALIIAASCCRWRGCCL